MSFDVMIVGIGGQGTILTSNILGKACVIEGIPVRGAETHGMAQRGGSVESQIRIGQEHGPLIAQGTADLLISFDLMEAARAAHWVKPEGAIYSSKEYVIPTSVFMQDFPAPTEAMLLGMLGTGPRKLSTPVQLPSRQGVS
jgi:indolepyruvate ferredoxin oxidoreductase beta subunit